MARRKAFIHIGLPHSSGDVLGSALTQYAGLLNVTGVRQPAKSADEMFRATVEIRRDHRAWGYRRREVEGAWSAICRRAHKGKDTVVFSQKLLAAASADEIALLLDRLTGFAVHIVITAPIPGHWALPEHADHDLVAVLDRWAAAVGRADRVHVIVSSSSNPGGSTWRALGSIVGFDASALDVAEPVDRAPTSTPALERHDELVELAERWGKAIAEGGYNVYGDVVDLVPARRDPDLVASTDESLAAANNALAAAVFEAERLRRRNDTLEERNLELQRKRKKLKRRLADVIVG